ncbi:MAG: hypothetical protein GC179_05645 [Anaerolineaceae bacterium]|nr:hypothetical protein [Anaerolineaceae bacterium]
MVVSAADILRTKLTPPPVRADLVLRPRLTQLFSASLEHPLTLICAPAGYGKTTLLGEWIVSDAGRAIPVAWLSLDEDDNDPVRFLTYLISAVASVNDIDLVEMLSLLRSPQPLPPKAVLTALISRLEDFPQHFILVLDDYHLIAAAPIHEALTFLLDHLPARMRLIMTSREDPLLPLARLRGRGQLAEIRADDLRFTPDEAKQFLEQMLGVELSIEQINNLDVRTEGWIAGLQMAALAMKGREDVGGFISAFTGSHRFILDYLTEEVLSRQSEQIQNFLLETSILKRMSGALCDALTGRMDGQVVLEQIERNNLFLIPLDQDRHWFRYHHLFGDILYRHLQRTKPNLVLELHRRASTWFEEHGWLGEAVGYALAGKDNELAVRLVEHYGERLRLIGEVDTVLRWLAALPDEARRSRPKLELNYAFLLARNSATVEAEQRVEWVEQKLLKEKGSANEPERKALLGQAAVVRATLSLIAAYEGDKTISAGRHALDLLPDSDLHWRSWVNMILGITYLESKGNTTEAKRWLDEAARMGEKIGDVFIQMISIFHLTRIDIVQGTLQQAENRCNTLLRLAHEPVWKGQPAAGYARLNRAWIRFERNELEAAHEDVVAAHNIMEAYGLTTMSLAGDVLLAWINHIQGHQAEAHELMQNANETIRRKKLTLVFVSASAWQAWLSLKQGDLLYPIQWSRSIEETIKGSLDPALEFEHITLARVLIAQGRLDEAQELLMSLYLTANNNGRLGRVIAICILQALATSMQGNIDHAIDQLMYALSLAEPEGYARTFLDEGPLMLALLRETKTRGIAVDYVTKLLAASDYAAAAESNTSQHPSAGELESLSERELEVLQLIAEGASNREIANMLVISIGTVKKHLNNIFLKLDSHSRTEAVATARKHNIL